MGAGFSPCSLFFEPATTIDGNADLIAYLLPLQNQDEVTSLLNRHCGSTLLFRIPSLQRPIKQRDHQEKRQETRNRVLQSFDVERADRDGGERS